MGSYEGGKNVGRRQLHCSNSYPVKLCLSSRCCTFPGILLGSFLPHTNNFFPPNCPRRLQVCTIASGQGLTPFCVPLPFLCLSKSFFFEAFGEWYNGHKWYVYVYCKSKNKNIEKKNNSDHQNDFNMKLTLFFKCVTPVISFRQKQSPYFCTLYKNYRKRLCHLNNC